MTLPGRWREFKYGSETLNSAEKGCAIEITGFIEDQSTRRIQTIGPVPAKAIQHRLCPWFPRGLRRRHFENFSPAVLSSIARGAVEIAGGVLNQRARLSDRPVA